MSYRLFSLLIFVSFCVVGCSFDETPGPASQLHQSPQKKEGPPVQIRRLPQPIRRTDIEVLWEIPDEPVDGFFVHFGYERTRLVNTVRIKVDELARFEDRKHGFVYSYILKGVAADRPLYFAVATYRGDEVSPPSPIIEVAPGLKRHGNFEKGALR